MPTPTLWHRIPKTLPEVRKICLDHGHVPQNDRYARAITLNLRVKDLHALMEIIGPGWVPDLRRALAYARVVVDLTPPEWCLAPRPARKACEPASKPTSPGAILATVAALTASVSIR